MKMIPATRAVLLCVWLWVSGSSARDRSGLVSPPVVDFVNGMGEVLPSESRYSSSDATMSNPMDLRNLNSQEITSGIINFLGLPAEGGDDDDGDGGDGELDAAPENDLQESAGQTPATTPAPVSNADAVVMAGKSNDAGNGTRINDEALKAKISSNELSDKKSASKEKKRKQTEAAELKNKGAMAPPPPRAGLGKVPHIRLGKVGFTAEKVETNVLHAKLSLSGRAIHGQTLKLDSHAEVNGALHLKGDGSEVKSEITGRSYRATVFVNKKNVKSCGIVVGDEGGLFDHNDGYITYESLSSKKGFKVNTAFTSTGPLYADGTLRLGGSGGQKLSKQTKRTVHTLLLTNRHMAKGGGFAVSETGGFFDFKDGRITYEPLDGANGFLVNSDFAVEKNSEFKGNMKITGTLTVEGGINFGKMEQFDAAFKGFKSAGPKVKELEGRVAELESTNSALMEKMERMEAMLEQLMSRR